MTSFDFEEMDFQKLGVNSMSPILRQQDLSLRHCCEMHESDPGSMPFCPRVLCTLVNGAIHVNVQSVKEYPSVHKGRDCV